MIEETSASVVPKFNGSILLCEDGELNQYVIKTKLVSLGFDVTVANNGKEGVDLVSARLKNGENAFDLIFMDIYMPVMDGMEAAEAIIKMGVKSPFVALTASTDENDVAQYAARGIPEWVSKPVVDQELYDCLYKHFTPLSFEPVHKDKKADDEKKQRIRLYTSFVRRNQSTYSDIIAALQVADMKTAHRIVHSLRGLAGLMGKTALQNTSRVVENALADENLFNIKELLKELEHELKLVLEELSPYLIDPKLQAVNQKTIDSPEAAKIFEELAPLLESDSAASLRFADELRHISGTDELITQIEAYEFEAARETLAKLYIAKDDSNVLKAKENESSRILVVDDEVSNIDALYHILCPTYDVVVAKDGRSALKKAEKHVPDIILLDVILPDMTGFDVITVLKHDDRTRRIPVIFITGLDNSEDEEKGLRLGAVDYIGKPFSNSVVKARVQTHIQINEYITMIERLCKVDALTNIANRRALDSQMASEWGRAVRNATPIAFMMIDIDHFKNYNDTYGHPQGDKLLKTVCAVFQQTLHRPTDMAARWGGEEFAILLPDTDLEGALAVAESIRANVEHTIVPCSDGTNTNVTVSIGVNSEIPINGRKVEDFISIADQALYNAKSTGRNRVRASRIHTER